MTFPGKATLIVADSDPQAYHRILGLLSREYVCVQVHTGVAALDKISELGPQLLIIDYNLPDTDALELLRRIKQEYPLLKTVFSADFGGFRLAADALESGADLLLPKPFTAFELRSKLAKLLPLIPRPAAGAGVGISERFARVERYIDDNIQRGIAQKEVLEIACLSRAAFYKNFKKLYGISYSEFLQERKLQKSKMLLSHKEKSIAQVSDLLGFQDPGYFSRWFRIHTLTTPTEYRTTLPAAEGPENIGILVPLSGAYASLGENILSGAQISIEEMRRRTGKLLRLYPIDTATNPSLAAHRVWQAVQEKGIRFFTGCANSSVELAVGEVIEQTHSLLTTSTGVSAGKRSSLYSPFRWSLPVYDAVRKSIIPLIRRIGIGSRWYTITADYVFGHSLLQNIRQVCREHGVRHVGNFMHPVGGGDFSAAFTQAAKQKADVIVLLNYADDTLNVLRQAKRLGISERFTMIVVWSSGLHDIVKAGPECARGVYWGTQYWHRETSGANREFVSDWRTRFHTYPSYLDVIGYITTRILLLSIAESGSFAPRTVARTLEQLEWNGLTTGHEYIQQHNHQTRKNYYVLRTSDAFPKSTEDIAEVVFSDLAGGDD